MFSFLLLAFQIAFAEPKIYNGQKAKENQFPWQVLLKLNQRALCGGTIIHPRYVLTAAHCVKYGSGHPSLFSLQAGSHLLNSLVDLPEIRAIHIHPDYRDWWDGVKTADLAIIELSSGIRLTESMHAIQLSPEMIEHPSDSTPQSNSDLNITISGWGGVNNAGKNPSQLQYADQLKLWNPSLGTKVLNHSSAPRSETNLIKTFKTGDYIAIIAQNNTVACHGDSGGPMVAGNPAKLIGISSHSTDGVCGKSTAFFYTRVSRYYEWINSFLKNEF